MQRVFASITAIVTLAFGSVTVAATPSDAASKSAEAEIQKVIAELKNGKGDKAIDVFFGSSQMINLEDPRVLNLKNQAANTIQLYGPVSTCSEAAQNDFSALVASRSYVCAHEKYATRWKFILIKLPSGWSGAAINFDDRVELGSL